MSLLGIAVAPVTVVVIALGHFWVMAAWRRVGRRSWTIFLTAGLALLGASVLIDEPLLAASMGILGATSLWSVREIFEQVKRPKA